MLFRGIVSSLRDTLSPQQALELSNFYLEHASKAKDPTIALVLCHDTEMSLVRARKAAKRVKDPAVRGGIANTYIGLGRVLNSRGCQREAQATYKKARKWGGQVQEQQEQQGQQEQQEQQEQQDQQEQQEQQEQQKQQEQREQQKQLEQQEQQKQLEQQEQQKQLEQQEQLTQLDQILPISSPNKNVHLARAKSTSKEKTKSRSNQPSRDRNIATIPQEIFPKNVRPPVVNVKLPESDERLTNTTQLACCLSLIRDSRLLNDILEPSARNWIQAVEKDADEQERLNLLATDVIRAFKRDGIKDAKAVAEVVCLAPVLGKDDFRYLLKELYKGVDESTLLDIHQLEGVAQLIQGAYPGYLDSNDLVNILELLGTRLRTTHNQSSHQMYQLTMTVSHVLDAMADTKVEGLDRERIHAPLLSYLNEIRDSSNPYLVYQAAYAYQALLHVPDDETLWQASLRRSGKMISGVFGLVTTAKNLDLQKFIEGLNEIQQGAPRMSGVFNLTNTYRVVASLVGSRQNFLDSLKEGFSIRRKLAWYPALRGAETLLRDGQLFKFKQLVCEAPCRRDPAFLWGVCQSLGEVAVEPMWDAEARRGAVGFLGEIYRNETVWGSQEDVKEWILVILMTLASSDGNDVQLVAEILLRDLESGADSREQLLFQACREKGPSSYPFRVPPIPLASPSLLDRAQNRPDIEGHIRQLMKQRLKEQVKSVYIPPQAKTGFQATDSARFQLMEKVNEFLGNDQMVFLLLGDSGAGKSTFNRTLECRLWQMYKKGGPIPLYINLPAIENPDHDMISKQLRKSEFTESQIGELKIHRKFILICDGYDESQQTHNLYATNRLNQPGEWEAKMVISCRSEYLGVDYRDWFQPGDHNRSESAQFQEAIIAPFSTDQINSYIDQYVALHQPLWEAKEYRHALDLIPSLKELVKNPFLMSLSLDVLPRMVDSRRNFMTTRITRVSLYDQFVEHWLERGKKRLGEKELSPQARAAFESLSDEGFTKNGIDFLKKLAVAIYKEQDGQPIVEYSRYKDEGSWKAEFFSREDKQLLREACPIVRNGNQHRFIHRSLLEYGLARGIFDPQDAKKRTTLQPTSKRRGSLSSVLSFEMRGTAVIPQAIDQEPDIESPLAWRSFVNESSLLEFLEERAQQDPVFKQQLLDYIEYSKRDKKWRTAAANAITILVRTGMQFSGADLRGIQIPGADLSYGMFDLAQLQGADLRKVNLRHVSLRQADLSGANMTGVQFGGLPYLTEDGSARSCAYSPGGASFAVGLDHGDISVYTTVSWDKKWTLQGHSGLITSVVYSPNGDRIASSSADATVRLWDVSTGVCCQVLTHIKGVENIVYSPQGDLVASCSVDNAIRIWEVETGDCRHTLTGHAGVISEVAYSPKGDQIASGGSDQMVRLWNVATGACNYILKGHMMEVTGVSFSPRGDIVASASRDETLRIWDVVTGTCLHLLMGHMDDVSCIVFSPTGSQVASGSKDGTVKLWDVDAGICCRTFTDHGCPVYNVAYSPQGDRIAASSDDTVILWDAQTGECSHTFSKPLAQMSMFLFSPNGDHVASATETGTVCLWDLGPGSTRNIATEHGSSVFSVKCSPKGHQVASCSKDKTIRLWDMETGACRQILAEQSGNVYGVSYSPRGNLIASCYGDKIVRLWDAESGICLHVLSGHTGVVYDVTFSPTGGQAASSSKDKTVRLWNAETGTWLRTLTGHSDRVYAVLYSPRGDQIATVSDDKTIRLWDVETGTCHHTLTGHTEWIASTVYSPNEGRIASGSWDKEVRLWDTNTGACLHILSGHSDKIRCVAYSTQGDQVASASWDRTVRLWDVETGECRHTLTDHDYPVEVVAFSPRGGLLVSGSMNGEARLWDVRTGECRQTFDYDDQNSTISYGIPLHRISWVTTGDGDSLVTCGEDGSVRMWQVINDEDLCRVLLRWRSTNGQLALEGVCTQDVQGLSELNRQLLELPGVVGGHVHQLEQIERSIRAQPRIADFNLL